MAGESTLPNAHTVRFRETNLLMLSVKGGMCRQKDANGLPDSPLPQQCGGARFSDSLRTPEENGTLG